MKRLFKAVVLHLLILLAKKRIQASGAEVIGITGTIGKTTAKEALTHLLSPHFRVFSTPSSYNSEFGIPLALLEEKTGFSSPFAWILILLRASYRVFLQPPKTYDYLILEMGVDKPGDMDELLEIVVPHHVIVTQFAEKYIEEGRFTSLEHMRDELMKLPLRVSENPKATLSLNADDVYQQEFIAHYTGKAKLLPYSLINDCGGETALIQDNDGLHGTYQKTLALHVPILGPWHMGLFLPCIALGRSLGLTDSQIQEAFSTFRLPPGRMNLIPGINGSLLLDSTYNATFRATIKALSMFSFFPAKRHIFLLGNMNAYGEKTEEYHRVVGQSIPVSVSVLVTVGPGPAFTREEALKKGFPKERAYHCENATEAGMLLQGMLTDKDVVLAKGSQNKVFLEDAIRLCMEHPEDAPLLLARQGAEWERKKLTLN